MEKITEKQTILVTGGSGFIGSNLVDELVNSNYDVCIIDKNEPAYRNFSARYYILDLTSDKIEEVFQKEPISIVIHLAAQTSVNMSVEDPKKDGIDNILATLNLLDNCKKQGINKIIAASSAAVYGEPEYLPIDENHKLSPISPYALSKYTMESYIKLSGLDYIIYRFSNVYGPRQANSTESGVISIFTNNLIKKQMVNIYGNGEQCRDFIYVKDIVNCIVKSLDFSFKNEIINLSSNTKTSINNLVKILQELTENHLKPNYLPARKNDIKESVLDNTKMLKLGLNINSDLKTGLKSTVDFYNYTPQGDKILIIIPARGGSVGIPRKNLRNLAGNPLIAYSIKNALNSKFNTDVYVSSDDDEILYISQKLGAQIYKRDASIADAATTLDPVIYDAYQKISKMNNTQYKLIVTLQPTSPLLKTSSLDNAIEIMLTNPTIDTIISAKDTTHLSWSKSGEEFVPNYKKRVNRQYLDPVYTETGGFLITRNTIITPETRIGKNTQLAILENPEEMIDIDNYEDFYLANYYLQRQNILFVVSGYDKIGFGHIYRALLLANNITNHNIKFLVTKDSKKGFNKLQQYKYKSYFQKHENLVDDIKELQADVVINDILNTDLDYIMELKSNNLKVINFEDLGEGAEKADLVINALYSKSNANKNTLWGYEYFCARDEFILSKTKNISEKVKNVLITFGGTDPNNLTQKVLNNIYPYCLKNNINIDIVLGLGYEYRINIKEFPNINIYQNVKNMADYMEKADIIFTACGRTVYEVACISTPCITLAQNERELTHDFASEKNGFINLGLGKNITDLELQKAFFELVENEDVRQKLHNNMLSKNLKKGTNKVINLILSTIERK